ncbi:MAG: hypothetical protein R3F17_01310 [Planctomycetota bacterium]
MSDRPEYFASPEDEDLFDFPVSPIYAAAGAEGPVYDNGLAPTSASVVEPIDLSDDDTPAAAQAPAAAAAPAPAPAPAPAAPAGPRPGGGLTQAEVDFDLDEDLFGFDVLFEANQPLSSEADLVALDEEPQLSDVIPATGPAPVAAAPAPAPKPAQAAPAAAKAAPAPKAPTTKAPSPAAGAPAPVAPAPIPMESVPAGAWLPPGIDAGPEPKRGRLLEILALSFLVLNTGLIALAWQAGSHFNETLASVTRSVSDAVAEGHTRGAENSATYVPNIPVQGSAPVEPEVASSKVEENTEDLEPADLLDMPRASLDLARERIRKGRYDDARRGLFHLLANRDRTALADEMVIEAETLIAESYAQQAMEVQK